MSKIIFLTSSPFTGRGRPFNTENEFVSRMQKAMDNKIIENFIRRRI